MLLVIFDLFGFLFVFSKGVDIILCSNNGVVEEFLVVVSLMELNLINE